MPEPGGVGAGDAQDPGDVLTLRLYVAGDAPNSCEARSNLAALLATRAANRYRLEVIDFLREPERAMQDGIVVTPTLVKVAPAPARKVIGTLREASVVLSALGLAEPHHA